MDKNAKEKWADIQGYEGKYQVSNLGNVRSLDRKRETHSNSYAAIKGIVLKKVIANTGYFVVNLCGKTHLVHRLIAEAFIPNPRGLPCINHIDENKLNNNIDNLEWVTHKENSNHGTMPSRMKDHSTRHNIYFNGISRTLSEWASATGITYNTLYSRLFLHCWPTDKALTASPNHGNNIKKLLEE